MTISGVTPAVPNPANAGLSAGLASTLDPQPVVSATAPSEYETAYANFEAQERAVLLQAAFGTSGAATAATAATTPTATTSDGQLNYTTIPDLPKPGALPAASPNAAAATVASPAIKSVTELLAESDAEAKAALAAYAKGEPGSTSIDVTA